MTFRDDRDAQLQRAEALERENARLRRELAARDAEAAARADEAARRSAEALERENAALRERLARARGPGLARRIGRRIAALRLAAPRGDGGYARAALIGWRLYVPIAAGLAVPAAALGDRAIWTAVAFALGAPPLVVLALLAPWALGHRRRATAGLVTGAALGVAASLAMFVPVLDAPEPPLHLAGVAGVYVAIVLMLVTRALRWREELVPVLIFAPILALPSPVHLAIWVGLAAVGAELADPPAPA